MRRERLIWPKKHANSIYCRDYVGLISVAHQAILRSNSRTSREFGVGYSHSCRKRCPYWSATSSAA
ncbi:hypothetical protein BW242_26375 [Escherichia coli]|nr:hypothetical protein BW242_26375 [Escherichia coli]